MGNSPVRSVVDVGSVIADTYTIEALIGRGGMGAVFLASHRRLPGKKVAIKLLHAEVADDELMARFRREAMIASQLNHPNIVDVTDFNVTPDGTPYLVLEYLHGESLAQRIKPGPMPIAHVMSIIRQVGSAIAAAHRGGIIHRDLKPQNIFLVPKEVDGRIVEIAKVLDFGISKIRDSGTVKTQESTLLGTPQYMSPEQATGQHALTDERTDIFALGAIVYEMLSGQPAFSGANIPEVVFKVVYEEPASLSMRLPGLPPGIAAVVARAMAKDAAARFPSVGAFVEALTGQPLLSVRTSTLPAPEVGFAAGSRHTGQDAFAQTMGSMDHHGTLPMTSSVPSSVPVAMPAGTVPRQGPPAPTHGGGVATVPAIPSAKRRGRAGLFAGLGLAIAGASAAVAFLVLRPPAEPPQPTAQGGVVTGDAGIAQTAQAPQAPADAAQAAGAKADSPPAGSPPAPADAAIAQAPPARDAAVVAPPTRRDAAIAAVRPRPPDPGDTGDGPRPPDPGGAGAGPEDEGLKKNLDDAQAALTAGQHDRAERLANTVINSADARPQQRARAYFIRGVVKCAQRDQELAVADLRNLRGNRGLQDQLIAKCKRAGVEIELE